jgi:hypothetical protein
VFTFAPISGISELAQSLAAPATPGREQVLGGGEPAGPVGRADRGDVGFGLIGRVDDEVDTAAAQDIVIGWAGGPGWRLSRMDPRE